MFVLEIMSEESDKDGTYLVRVRAQVMTRDDSSGGWVPLGGGGLSNVSVRKRVITTSLPNNNGRSISSATSAQQPIILSQPGENGEVISADETRKTSSIDNEIINRDSDSTSTINNNSSSIHTKHEYLICGRRISDQTTVLSCIIKKDFEYNKVMPTFHHWRTGDKRFGLTFQTAADARAFDKGVRLAVQDLLEGVINSYQLKHKDIVDDDVFMTLNLPMEVTPKLTREEENDMQKRILPLYSIDKKNIIPKSENYSYVQLTALHDYTYPIISSKSTPLKETNGKRSTPQSAPGQSLDIIVNAPLQKSTTLGSGTMTGGAASPVIGTNTSLILSQSSSGMLSHHSSTGGIPRNLPKKGLTQRCRYCNEYFLTDNTNARGSCHFAPDCFKRSIDVITCISCAQCMLYHCMSDSEGDFAMNPCECTSSPRQDARGYNQDDDVCCDSSCTKRWMMLTILSFFVPCLWCYPPLKACHMCCVKCGLCGGRHSPQKY